MESVIELDEGRLAGEVTGFEEEDSETGSSLSGQRERGGEEEKREERDSQWLMRQ